MDSLLVIIHTPLHHTFDRLQHSTSQHSTAQHSTAQHSTAQHSTASLQLALLSMACPLSFPDGLSVVTQTNKQTTPKQVPPVLRSLPAEEDIITVTVWDDTVEAAATNADCDAWFSKFLRKPCRLVRMLPAQDHQRAISPKHVPAAGGAEKAVVSFADGFPGLLLAEESLTELNTRCGTQVSVRNFRPV